MVMKLSVLVFWLVILCGFAGAYSILEEHTAPPLGLKKFSTTHTSSCNSDNYVIVTVF